MKPVVCAGIIVADHVSSPLHHVPVAGELIIADSLASLWEDALLMSPLILRVWVSHAM